MTDTLSSRYDFVVYFDVVNGNPNGDPDAGNRPRIDPETRHGIVSNCAIKRKIRNRVELENEGVSGYSLYISDSEALNTKCRKAYAELGYDGKPVVKLRRTDPDLDVKIKDYMCATYWDVRAFGAVFSEFMKDNLKFGMLKGPVQIDHAESVDDIVNTEITITRQAVTREEDAVEKNRTMGRKSIVPYGLYRFEGYISANLARNTGFCEKDAETLWNAILYMFEDDRSAGKGRMTVRKIIIFRHESMLGNCHAHKLFDRVQVKRKKDVMIPRSPEDYDWKIDTEKLPEGISCRILE